MSNFQIVPLNAAYAEHLRQSTHDDFGHRLESSQASANGYGPCRCCLRQTQPGENRLLFSHAPVGSDNAYNEVGKIKRA